MVGDLRPDILTLTLTLGIQGGGGKKKGWGGRETDRKGDREDVCSIHGGKNIN